MPKRSDRNYSKGRVEIRGGHHRDQRIVLRPTKFGNRISDGAVLEDCEIVLDCSAKYLAISDSVFRRCRVHAKRSIVNCAFYHGVRFESCTFKGQFKGCEFGDCRAGHIMRHPAANVTDCDFREAVLHLCTFFDCGADTILWPRWPSIALRNPGDNRRDWLAIPLPPSLELAQQVVVDDLERAAEVSAECLHLPSEGVDPDAVWPLIQDRPYIVFDGKEAKPKAVRQNVVRLRREMERENKEAKRQHASMEARCYVWNTLNGAELRGIRAISGQTFDVELGVPFLTGFPPCSNGLLVVRLLGCSTLNFVKGDAVLPWAKALEAKFTIRGGRATTDAILVNSYRKDRQVLMQLESTEYRTAAGKAIAREKLNAAVEEYWRKKFGV